MSHIVEIQIRIKDLKALGQAARQLGLEMVEEKSFLYYGRQRAACDYVLRVVGNTSAYEIGVVKSKTNAGEYELQTDFFNGGKGLVEKVGQNASKLKQTYSEIVATKQLRKQGMRVMRRVTTDGKVILTASR